MTAAGCRAFTPELRSVAWPGKFKPDLPPRYDGTPDPAEFLQLYELSIEAAKRDEKVMANWFLIRPFCIMLLYQYLLHYRLLLHIITTGIS